jgi:hypothetical protein
VSAARATGRPPSLPVVTGVTVAIHAAKNQQLVIFT